MAGSNRTDWVVNPNYGLELTVEDGAVVTGEFIPLVVLLGLGVGFESPGTGADVHEFQDNETLTLLRVRGQVRYFMINSSHTVLHERIMIGIQDLTNGTVAFPVDDTTSTDAEDSFLWERLSPLEAHASTVGHYPAQTDHPWWTNIDVKSKRRLNRGECIVYCVAFDEPTTISMSLVHSMRTLVRR